MKLVVACFLTFTLSACSNSSSFKGRGGNNYDETEGGSSLKNETDYSVCGNTTTRTSIEGLWTLQKGQENLRITTSLNIRADGVDITNTCAYQGYPVLIAQVSVSARHAGGILEILAAGSKSEQRNETDSNGNTITINCDTKIDAVRMNYYFKGNCLALVIQGQREEIAFVPQ